MSDDATVAVYEWAGEPLYACLRCGYNAVGASHGKAQVVAHLLHVHQLDAIEAPQGSAAVVPLLAVADPEPPETPEPPDTPPPPDEDGEPVPVPDDPEAEPVEQEA